jgi:hypothetical protein
MLSGEMGRSIWEHPASYLQLLSKYRAALSAGKHKGDMKAGVALHWNKVCGGCFDMPETKTYQIYNATYHQIFSQNKAAILKRYDTKAIQKVFEASDVIGISHYAPAPQRGVSPGTFSLPIDTAAFELSHWGVNLKGLIAKGSRDFLFSEVGLGGGDPNNQRTATSLAELATNIHNGIWAVYNVAQDPWRNQDYKEFRREWFK